MHTRIEWRRDFVGKYVMCVHWFAIRYALVVLVMRQRVTHMPHWHFAPLFQHFLCQNRQIFRIISIIHLTSTFLSPFIVIVSQCQIKWKTIIYNLNSRFESGSAKIESVMKRFANNCLHCLAIDCFGHWTGKVH